MATVQIPILHEYFKPEIPIYGRFLYEIRNYMKIRAVIPLCIFDAKQIFIAVKQLYMIHHLIKRTQRITTFFMRCHFFILAVKTWLVCQSIYSFFIFTVWRVSFLFLFLFMFLTKAALPRQILMEGPLQLLDSGKAPEMFVILFDDMLLITRKKKGLSKKVSPHNPLWGPLFYSSLISLILVLTSSAFFVVVISQIFSTQWTKTLDTFPVRQSHGCPHRTS